MSNLRHVWVKLKEHHYLCSRCGLIKINVLRGGGWVQEWSTPDGDRVELRFTPACAPGAKTSERLAWLAARAETTTDVPAGAVEGRP